MGVGVEARPAAPSAKADQTAQHYGVQTSSDTVITGFFLQHRQPILSGGRSCARPQLRCGPAV